MLPRFTTIRYRILIIFFVLGICLSAIFTIISQYYIINALKKNIDGNANLMVKNFSEKIGNWISERKNEMEIFANCDVVESMDWPQMERYLQEEAIRHSNTYVHLFLADKLGNYSTTLKRNAGSVSDREYFKTAMQGKSVISEPVISKSTGKQVSVVTVPIINRKSQVIGMLGGALDLVKLYQWIKDFRLDYTNSYSYIIDKEGLIITHPRKEYILNLALSDKLDTNTINTILNHESGSVHYTFEGERAYAYFKEIKNTDGWKIITKIPVGYFLDPVSKFRNILVLISLAFMLIMVFIGIWLSRTISKPIIELTHVFRKGILGNIRIRANENTGDEIGEAGRYFNQMMDRYVELLNKLKERELSLQEYIDHLITFNGKLSAEGNILMINETTLQKLRQSPEGLIGKKIWDIDWFNSSESSRKKIQESFFQVLRGETVRLEEMIRRDDGDYLVIDLSFRPVFDKFQNISYIVMEGRDISDKARLENELLNARKLDSIGVMAGGIAHDFNNIMTVLLGTVSLLKHQLAEDSEIREKVEMAEKAIYRATDLTKQLLTFSKGGIPVKKRIHLKKLIRDSINFISKGFPIHCEYDIPDNLDYADIDEGQFSQVVYNIVINSVQSMPENGKIKISAENVRLDGGRFTLLKRGNYIHIKFLDNGPGIPPENLEKIFDPYFTTKENGSGLGLAICYSIIKKHDGYIRADSEVGKGTTISIYLPSSQNKTENRNNPVLKSKTKGKARILVMDDDLQIRKTLGSILDYLGYEIDFSDEGNTTLDLYKKSMSSGRKYNSVILDLTIPGGMGGKETMEKLLEIDPDVVAIVSSGYSNDPILASYQDYGFKGLISKPYVVENIENVLNEVLGLNPSE